MKVSPLVTNGVRCVDAQTDRLSCVLVKRKGASRQIFFMQAWVMELGQRILKVHGDSHQIADFSHEDRDASSCTSCSIGFFF